MQRTQTHKQSARCFKNKCKERNRVMKKFREKNYPDRRQFITNNEKRVYPMNHVYEQAYAEATCFSFKSRNNCSDINVEWEIHYRLSLSNKLPSSHLHTSRRRRNVKLRRPSEEGSSDASYRRGSMKALSLPHSLLDALHAPQLSSRR